MFSIAAFIDQIVDVNSISATYMSAFSNPAVFWTQWTLMIISLLDFTIYTFSFLYGVLLAFLGGRNVMDKFSAVGLSIGFLVTRFFYLPFLLLLIPLQNPIVMPLIIYKITLFVLALFYIVILLMPLCFAVAWLLKFRLWFNSTSTKYIKSIKKKVQKREAKNQIPNLIVMMPIYNEEPEALCMAVESIVESIYPLRKITVYLSFDDDQESDLVLALLSYLTQKPVEKLKGTWTCSASIVYKEVLFRVNGFPHGGKRNTQAETFKLMKSHFSGRESDTFVLYVDSDIVLHPDAMLQFIRSLEKNKSLIGMTGFISAISSRKINFLWYLQDCEYAVGQIIIRSLEAGLGGVTCLPGALTMVRLKELSKAAETYFSSLSTEKIFDFHRFHLGEDRFLTHLLMQQSDAYALGFCPAARAKTVAPDTWTSFVKQRRRWLLGAFSNEVYFLADFKLWCKMPMLLLYKLLDFASRSASFFIYIIVLLMAAGVPFNLPQQIIIWSPLALTWLLVTVMSFMIARKKVAVMYPIMVLLNPWLYFFINIYALLTWDVRSWGGPRTNSTEDVESPASVAAATSTTAAGLSIDPRMSSLDLARIREGQREYNSAGSDSGSDYAVTTASSAAYSLRSATMDDAVSEFSVEIFLEDYKAMIDEKLAPA